MAWQHVIEETHQVNCYRDHHMVLISLKLMLPFMHHVGVDQVYSFSMWVIRVYGERDSKLVLGIHVLGTAFTAMTTTTCTDVETQTKGEVRVTITPTEQRGVINCWSGREEAD